MPLPTAPTCLLSLSLALALAAPSSPSSAPAKVEPMKQPPSSAESHAESVEKWRKQRMARLTSDEGWLTVAGLFWLKEGANTFGSASDNPIRLPAHSSPRKNAPIIEIR